MKNIVIIHYNTPKLTECLVESIKKFVSDAKIFIFDNSDTKPFLKRYDNLIVFDNTKGKYIDFDKFLSNYPKRTLSSGKYNNWGSAKHCISVEKCMDLLNDSFMLLDSDILLKKDISNLFDEQYSYIGETVNQPGSTIKRILPFMCFINAKFCKKNGIHYFDDNYMHGLRKEGSSDSYDTGAAFYLHTRNTNYKDIKLDEYIIHYKGGSWETLHAKRYGEILTPDEWLNVNKRFWTGRKNKKVIYTCITGGYDGLRQLSKINDDFDYICFSDNTTIKQTGVWEIRPIPNELLTLSKVKQQRNIKICPHKYLKEYDMSIWIDGNVDVVGDVNELLTSVLKNDVSIYIPKHPSRDCIYDEGSVCIRMKKDTAENINPQMDKFNKEGFPKHYGLPQSNIIIRKHNNSDCIRLMNKWVEVLNEGSHRDQLSFNYALWKNSDVKVYYLDKMIYRSKWFNWGKGHGKNVSFKQFPIINNQPLTKKITVQEITKKKVYKNRVLKAKKRLNTNVLYRLR